MATILKIPALQARMPIVDQAGKPVSSFLTFLNNAVIGTIQNAFNANAETLEALGVVVAQLQATTAAAQAAQQAANNAQETADDAGGTATSGSAMDPAIDLTVNGAWEVGPQVDLAGVVAGTLTITATGPQQDDDVSISSGSSLIEFRVQEIVGGIETTVFTGNGAVSSVGGSYIVTNNSSADVQAFTDARVSTGAVSYRLDARKTTGLGTISSLLLYIFVRRTT